MKRLIVLALTLLLAFCASQASAQRGIAPKLITQQLRWADYSDASTNQYCIATLRDTAFFAGSGGLQDTTEVFDASRMAWGLSGSGVTTGNIGIGRWSITSSHTNADSFYVGIDGAFSPCGPWARLSIQGVLGQVAGQSTEGLMTGVWISDVDDNSAITSFGASFAQFPYYRFVFLPDRDRATALAGARFYLSYYTWEN